MRPMASILYSASEEVTDLQLKVLIVRSNAAAHKVSRSQKILCSRTPPMSGCTNAKQKHQWAAAGLHDASSMHVWPSIADHVLAVRQIHVNKQPMPACPSLHRKLKL